MPTKIATTKEFQEKFPKAIQIGGGLFDVGGGEKWRLSTDANGGYTQATPATTPAPLIRIPYEEDTNAAGAAEAKAAAERAALTPPDLNVISAEELERRRGKIDVINKKSDLAIEGEREEGRKREMGIRALAGQFGWMGSPTALGERGRVREVTQRQIELQEAIRAEEIASVLDEVEKNAADIYEAQLAENKEAIDNILKRAKEAGDAALKSIPGYLAERGIHSYDDAARLDPEFFRKLKEQTGYSDYQIASLYNQNLPESSRPYITETWIPDPADPNKAILRSVTINKQNGKSTSRDTTVDIPYKNVVSGERITMKDGSVAVLYPDGTYKTVIGAPPVTLARGARLIDPKTGKTIAEGAPIPPPTGSTISLSEANRLGLPTSLVGKSEAEIAADLENDEPAPWFKEKLEKDSKQSLQPSVVASAWREFQKIAGKPKVSTPRTLIGELRVLNSAGESRATAIEVVEAAGYNIDDPEIQAELNNFPEDGE